VTSSPAADPEIAIRGLSKRFGATLALDDVDLDIAAGEIHALCGGNGSGKSTLIKALVGVHRGEPGGEIHIRGERVAAEHMTAAAAHRAGIRVVHQDLGLFPDLTVAENLSLGSGFETGAGARIRWGQVRARAAELIERFEIDTTPTAALGSLSRATQTQVAIARALQGDESEPGALLILDEPTTALPAHEVDLLVAALRRYAAQGQAILYVSHRLDEILSLTDRVSILRDGRMAGTWQTADLTEEELIRLIIDRELAEVSPRDRAAAASGSDLLRVEDLWSGPLRGVDLRVREGEIVGLAGLLGSGRTELLRAVFGDAPTTRGRVVLDGRPVRFRHPRDAVRAGVAMVPEDRLTDAAFVDMPIYANMAMTRLRRYWRRLRMGDAAMRSDADGLARRYRVKAASTTAPLSSLSGGNQQKVVMARWLQSAPRLLLLDEPSQGVDVGARADIYTIVREACDAGAGALVAAADLEELAQVADRVVVLRDGRVAAEVTGADITAHRLVELSYGDGTR
jgi:ribose transport system ATP-binding protein